MFLIYHATTQCACADFVDFATPCNGGRGGEKDLYCPCNKCFFMNKSFRIFLYTMTSESFFSPYSILGGGDGVTLGPIMSHGMVHPETWCDTQSNTGIAIYEYLSKLTEK
jgi:hypothetical protein